MNKNKALHIALVAVLFLAGAIGASAQKLEIGGNAPTVYGTSDDTAANNAIRSAWDAMINPGGALWKEIGGIDAKPEKLIRAFGDASAFSSHAGTQRGYGQPTLFGASIGLMGGAKIGSSIANATKIADTLQDDLKRDGDVAIGAGIGVSAQFSFNASFLLPGLSLGVKFGSFNLGSTVLDNFDFKTQSAGITASYQLIEERTLVPVFLTWRGITAGSGLFYQKTDMNYTMEVDSITQDIGGGYSANKIRLDPRLRFSMISETTTIPLEITTAIQLFSFLNITLGGGADIAFGTNTLKISAESDVTIEGLSATPGRLTVTGGGDMSPTYLNPKLLTGVGFKMGPAFLDVPVTLYFGEETGASVGVTVGVLW